MLDTNTSEGKKCRLSLDGPDAFPRMTIDGKATAIRTAWNAKGHDRIRYFFRYPSVCNGLIRGRWATKSLTVVIIPDTLARSQWLLRKAFTGVDPRARDSVRAFCTMRSRRRYPVAEQPMAAAANDLSGWPFEGSLQPLRGMMIPAAGGVVSITKPCGRSHFSARG